MKKAIIVIIILLSALLALNLLFPSKAEENSAKELIISPCVYDADVTDLLPETERIRFEPLKLNETRYLAAYPAEYQNLNIRLEFDGGLIEVISEACDIQLSAGDNKGPWNYSGGYDNRIYDAKLRVPDGSYIAINPIASGMGYLRYQLNDPNWDTSENYAGREYYLAVNAYSFDNESSPVVTAKLKLVQLGKPENPDEVMTGYYSIELISYEYNDAYKMMEDLYK